MKDSNMPINITADIHPSWFSSVTVEPIPSVKEYKDSLSGKERRSSVDASVRQWAYHKMRLG